MEASIDATLLTLSQSFEFKVKTYKIFNIQGFKLRTKLSKESNCTQNTGVVVMAMTTSYTSVHDNDSMEGDITYYEVIKDIIELSINERLRKIVDWANNKNKTDKHGFTLVDFTRTNKKTCPFILPSCKNSSCRIHWISLGGCLLS